MKIAVLGGSGLIGSAIATDLKRRRIPFVAIARRFTAAQRASFANSWIEAPIVDISPDALGTIFAAQGVDIVINCIGVLQNGPKGCIGKIHAGFAAALIKAIRLSRRPILLVQISIPGTPAEDRTQFSKTKRAADQAIKESDIPFVILRPGFVIAPTAYGGSALIRALAALPFALPGSLANRPFTITAVSDITQTLAQLASRWRNDERDWRAVWDVMEIPSSTVGEVVTAFRTRLGGASALFRLPMWLLALGAKLGDAANLFGWLPPVRSTALSEMRRGVCGDPGAWIAATGIVPKSLEAAFDDLPATIQEKWFARLYFAKPFTVAVLSFFWIASGLVALTAGAHAAIAALISHGIPAQSTRAILVGTGTADVLIGIAIGVRRTSKMGLQAGILLSLIYLALATLLAPELWTDPLGPLVKVLPIIVMMGAGVAVSDDR